MKRRENVKVAIRPMDSITSLTYVREVKNDEKRVIEQTTIKTEHKKELQKNETKNNESDKFVQIKQRKANTRI